MWHSHPAVNRRAHITTKKLHDRKIFCCQQTPKAQDSFGCLYKDKSIPHHVSHAPWVGSSPNSTALHSPCHPPPQSFSFTQVLEIRISAYFTLLATLTARKLRYKSPKEKRKENDRQGIKRANKFSFNFHGLSVPAGFDTYWVKWVSDCLKLHYNATAWTHSICWQ